MDTIGATNDQNDSPNTKMNLLAVLKTIKIIDFFNQIMNLRFFAFVPYQTEIFACTNDVSTLINIFEFLRYLVLI